MILWQAGLALVGVWKIFGDPAFDYRLVIVGALLPDAIDALAGGTWVSHTLAASACLLALVMLVTRRRRNARRRLLALPIGSFLHLVLDGVWMQKERFWWPAFGGRLHGPLPGLDHGIVALAVEEVLGLAALVWAWYRFGLADQSRRRHFLREGRLSVLVPSGGAASGGVKD